MRTYMIISLFFSFSLIAQTRYTVKGFFPEAGVTTPISYSLNWIENGGELKGLYKDSTIKESIPVTVVPNERTRIFQVPRANAMTLITTIPTAVDKTKILPVSITLADSVKTIMSANLYPANLIITEPQAQESSNVPCREGFGGLAGFCGSYQGMVVEEQDTSNRCQLTDIGTPPRLFLNELGELGIRVAPVSVSTPNPIHILGRIPLNNDRSSVDLIARVCRPLDGTSFKDDDCKRINVTGDFSTNKTQTAHFFGTYSIVDEKTNERCQYRLSLDRTI